MSVRIHSAWLCSRWKCITMNKVARIPASAALQSMHALHEHGFNLPLHVVFVLANNPNFPSYYFLQRNAFLMGFVVSFEILLVIGFRFYPLTPTTLSKEILDFSVNFYFQIS